MSEKSRNWINEHESWWNECTPRTLKLEHLERILDDYERTICHADIAFLPKCYCPECGK